MSHSKISTLLREPLLHFLLIGACLFLVYDLLNDDTAAADTIIISKAKLDHLGTLWEKKRLRKPTADELDNMIEQQVREEVLVREALAMGLDIDDEIIRRRLAQKMEFITTDLAMLSEPTEKELNDYLATHIEQFALPAQLDFVQIFINPDEHGSEAHDIAISLLKNLSDDDLTQDEKRTYLSSSGDTHMLDREYRQQTRHSISRWFGSDFAQKLFELPVDSWQGPVRSGYGLHLVRITNKKDAQPRSLEKVRDKVLAEWQHEQRRELDKKLYGKLRQRYQVIIER